MNTLKNLIVTGMLLVVAYGAYVVLQTGPTPPPLSGTEPGDGVTPDDVKPPTINARLEGPIPSPPRNPGDAVVKDPQSKLQGSGPGGVEIPPYQPAPDMAGEARRYEPNPNAPNGGAVDPALKGALVGGRSATPIPAPDFGDSTDSAGGSDSSATSPANPSDPSNPSTAQTPNDLASSPPSGAADFETVWGAMEKRLANNELAPALTELSMYFRGKTLTEDQYQRSVSLLDSLAATVVYSRESLMEPPYTVVAGDSLTSIAERHKVTPEFLAKLNGIPVASALTPGEKIKVLTGPFEAEVDATRKELTMYLGRCYAGRFPVELGPNLPPGTSDYEIAERTPGRAYFDNRTTQQVAAGAPENPFGTIWLGLRGQLVTAAHQVGIHSRGQGSGVLDTSSIVVSQQDAEDVYAILSVGSRVRVRR